MKPILLMADRSLGLCKIKIKRFQNTGDGWCSVKPNPHLLIGAGSSVCMKEQVTMGWKL